MTDGPLVFCNDRFLYDLPVQSVDGLHKLLPGPDVQLGQQGHQLHLLEAGSLHGNTSSLKMHQSCNIPRKKSKNLRQNSLNVDVRYIQYTEIWTFEK